MTPPGAGLTTACSDAYTVAGTFERAPRWKKLQ